MSRNETEVVTRLFAFWRETFRRLFVARKETKRQRSWHLVSPERTTRKSESSEAAALRSSGIFGACKRKETKHCRIFAQQMYGEITCVAGYRSVHRTVLSCIEDT